MPYLVSEANYRRIGSTSKLEHSIIAQRPLVRTRLIGYIVVTYKKIAQRVALIRLLYSQLKDNLLEFITIRLYIQLSQVLVQYSRLYYLYNVLTLLPTTLKQSSIIIPIYTPRYSFSSPSAKLALSLYTLCLRLTIKDNSETIGNN